MVFQKRMDHEITHYQDRDRFSYLFPGEMRERLARLEEEEQKQKNIFIGLRKSFSEEESKCLATICFAPGPIQIQ